MTTITIGSNFLLDMRPGGGTLADLGLSTVLSRTETELAMHHEGPDYTIGGTFTGDDGNGLPTGGTVTSFNVVIFGLPIADITGMSMSWTDFWNFATTDNYTGFLSAVFHGNDTLNGSEVNGDVLFGFDGIDDVYGGGGNDILNGGRGGDALYGGEGDDVLQGTNIDVFSGGDGFDRVVLRANTSGLLIEGWWMTGVEMMRLARPYSYNIVMQDDVAASGQTFTVNALLDAGHNLVFDGSAETDGSYFIYGSAGDDDLTGGAGNDTFHLARGGHDAAVGMDGDDLFVFADGFDTAWGGTGADTFRLVTPGASTSTGFVSVRDFDADSDRFDLPGVVSLLESTVNGTADAATFDADIASAIGPALYAGHAMLLDVTGGEYVGTTFLLVDGDGLTGYTAGADYVINATGITGTLDTSDFI